MMEQELDRSIRDLLLKDKYIFYGLFLAELNKSFNDAIPTACVGRHPDIFLPFLNVNPKFWRENCRTESQKRFVLVHEVEHVVREHITLYVMGAFPDKLLFNIAADLSINQTIAEEYPTTPSGERVGVHIDDYASMKWDKNESSFYYYKKLQEAKQKKDDGKGEKDSKNPDLKKGNKRGTTGDRDLDKLFDDIDDGKYEDFHKLWDEIRESSNDGTSAGEVFRRQIEEKIKRVAEETEKSRGLIPTHIKNAISENFNRVKQVVDWRSLFRNFVGSTISTEIYSSRKRPNFRFEDSPSNKYKQKVRIVVGVDSSGSVSDHELAEFFGQINTMYKAGALIDVCIWDAEVHKEYEYKGEMLYERVCQGGTVASSFIKHVNLNCNKKRWNCAINLTDGYIESKPSPCKLPMLWVITKTGSLDFQHQAKKIKMT